MKFFLHLFCFLAFAISARAADPGDPSGALRLLLRGASDTVVSLPLQQASLVDTSIVSRSGAVITINDDFPALPAGGAYILVMSGALEGAVLPIVSVAGAVATIESGPYDLSTLQIDDLAAVIPYWTLDTVFPGGQGVHASTSVFSRASEVLCFDDSVPGTDHAATARFFYLTGQTTRPNGWYRVGDLNQLQGDYRLPPHQYFQVRHNVTENTELLVCGSVQLSRFNVPLQIRAANTAQDNLVALPIPVPMALADAGLIESGAFTPSTSMMDRADEVQLYDNTVVGQQKAASSRYFYFIGDISRAAGWYRVGDTSAPASLTLLPGEGLTIRKRASVTPHADLWKALPEYLE